MGSGDVKAGVVAGVSDGLLAAGVVVRARAVEARVGRWMGWTSEIGVNGLPLALIETFDLLGFLLDLRLSLEERLWKRPRKLERTPFDMEF